MLQTCSSCGASLRPNAKFCNTCGSKVTFATPAIDATAPSDFSLNTPNSPPCPACGNHNNASARFCRHCGAAMDGSKPGGTDAPSLSKTTFDTAEHDDWSDAPPFWKRPWFIAALLVVIVAGCSGAWYVRNQPATLPCVGSDASSRPECAQAAEAAVTGESQEMFLVADANIRDQATAIASNVITKLLRGAKVSGVMQFGADGESRWLKLSDGRGFVGATNLSSSTPPELSRVFDNMAWNVEGATELLVRPEAGSQIVASLASGEGTTLAGVTTNGYAEAKLKQGGVGYFIITGQNDATGVLSGTSKELTLSFNHDTCDFGPDFKPYFDMALRNAQKLGKIGDGVSSYVKLNGAMFGLHPTAVGAHSESSGIYFQEDSGQVVKAFLDHGFRFEKNDEFVGYSLIDGSTSGVGASIFDATGEEAQYGKSSFSCGL